MSIEDKIIEKYCERVGYTDEEVRIFLDGENKARLVKSLFKAAPLYFIEAEVIGTRHCATGYKIGEKFILDVAGNLVNKYCPPKICVFLISQLSIPVALINERLSEDLDPNNFTFMKQVKCPDAGVECSGYGEVMLKVKVVSRKEVINNYPAK